MRVLDMKIGRVALIYDDRPRPETTGVYCRRALESLVQVTHFRSDELSAIPAREFDLYLNIDDGLRYHLPAELRPCALWAIDTHMDFGWCLEKARGFDLVFAAQRDGADQLRRAGIDSAVWLPLACDPEVHRKHDVPKRYDVAFVGHTFPGPRDELLNVIRWRYRDAFLSQAYFDEMARIYSAARTAFNRSIKNDVNMRVFEAVACGSLLVTNDLADNGQDELFQDGVHLAIYREPEELLDKLAFYLGRDEVRERIAAAGRAEAIAKHTYRHRMERLLSEAEAALARAVVGSGSLQASEAGDIRSDPVERAEDTRPTPSIASNGQRTTNDGPTEHDPFYFGHARPEVMALVPVAARRILDIGCGAGRLGEALKARQQAEVVGIEFDEAAAAVARLRIDEVWVGDVERIAPEFPPGSFDAIVCADVLEHLRDPERLLRKARSWLASDGRLIASIPNVKHHSVVRSLLEGNWTYMSEGLLDRTHLRFFTRREIEKLLHRAGFAIDEMRWAWAPGETQRDDRPGEIHAGRLHITGLSDPDADDFHAYQYLVAARPASCIDHGVTTIVILTHNQLEYTRLCLDSLRSLTDEPYELIVVDNGSTDGTVEYLRALPGVRLIANETNRGFPAAANQGIAAATGNQILLLNNDVVLTTGWLGRLLRALHSDPAIGLVGPCSNCVSGPQQVETRYESLADLDGFAWDWGKQHNGQRVEVSRLVGFCLLIRREVVAAIGLLDEQFGVGCYDDDDYCLRAIQTGYRAVIAADAFIHHFGGRTFLGIGADFSAVMDENRRRFQAKWATRQGGETSDPPGGGVMRPAPNTFGVGSPAPNDSEPRRFVATVDPGGGLRLAYEKPRLSLCMIVRDSARTLPACLESIRPWVDEMVIVDTGSVDDTPRIVESFGGRLFHFPWCDDFSAARNESLRHARGDWLFWMDSDDTIPEECGRQLRGLIERPVAPNVLGFVMQVHCPGGGEDGDPATDVTAVDHVKIFRNRPDLRFDGRIHEQVLPAIRRAGGEVAWTDLYVVHSGSDQSRAGQERKLRRDLRLLELELAERPEHPFTLFNLGMTHVHASRFAEAAGYLRRGIARSGPEESHLRKAFALLVYAEMRLKHHDAALEACRQGRAMFPRDVELRFREGVLLHELGRLEEARRAYRDVLESREERHFSSVDRSLSGFKARQNLAVVANDLGELAEAEEQWRRVVAEVPGYRPGWRGLGETLIRRGRFEEAGAVAERLLSDESLRVEGFLIKSRIALARGRIPDAVAELDRAAMEEPDDAEILSRRCQILFEHGKPDDAERALKSLIEHAPEDPSAHYNLGTLLLRTHRYDEAACAYRQSLRFRTNHPATYLNLGCALKDSGRIEEAVLAWEQALRLVPGDPSVRAELAQVGRRPSCSSP
jgi:GT2 family glycosyltransferase/tetratricopeptide (TPR) repeat protein/2-polyprenyl-3-methyl-5-hydroxy-6-metoxy-1,4-benzoquinol methylase